jgi:hypothetical protein
MSQCTPNTTIIKKILNILIYHKFMFLKKTEGINDHVALLIQCWQRDKILIIISSIFNQLTGRWRKQNAQDNSFENYHQHILLKSGIFLISICAKLTSYWLFLTGEQQNFLSFTYLFLPLEKTYLMFKTTDSINLNFV